MPVIYSIISLTRSLPTKSIFVVRGSKKRSFFCITSDRKRFFGMYMKFAIDFYPNGSVLNQHRPRNDARTLGSWHISHALKLWFSNCLGRERVKVTQNRHRIVHNIDELQYESCYSIYLFCIRNEWVNHVVDDRWVWTSNLLHKDRLPNLPHCEYRTNKYYNITIANQISINQQINESYVHNLQLHAISKKTCGSCTKRKTMFKQF